MTDARPSAHLTREDQKRALLEAAQAAVQDAHEKDEARRSLASTRTSKAVVTTLGLLLFGVGIYLLAARPAWFFTPPAPPEAVEIQEASIRLMLVREADRVKRYRAEHRRLPATLEETGSATRGIAYRAEGDSAFHLAASLGDHSIGLSSRDSVAAFLGNSLKVIAARGRP